MSTLLEGQRLGPYRIIRLLGEGGMGAVYEARQEPLDRRVALKTLRPEYAGHKDAVARFFNEAKALSKLEHPSIVQVSDFGNAADGTAYLVMEYLRGQSLGGRLSERDGRLPVVVALQLAWQVADVLAVAHTQGVVHRDLKPDNLMLVADPIAPGGERVKVLDFGIAKLTRESDRGGVKTDTLAVMGTPLYMSPEQCAGAGGVDDKTDVYSLGCVLYQALAGRPPYMADGAGQIIGMHLFQAPPPLASLAPKVPPQVAELVHRLLTKDKGQRPSMSDAADEIGRLLSKLSGAGPVIRSRPPVSTDPEATRPVVPAVLPSTLGQSIGQRGRAGTQRRRLAAAGLAAIAGLAFVGVVVTLRAKRVPPGAVVRDQVQTPPLSGISTGAISALPAVAPAPPNPLPKKIIRWTVSSQPLGATVLDDKGRALGITPWTEEHEAAAGNIVIRLRRDGFIEAPLKLDRGTDVTEVVTLSRSLAAAQPKAKAVPPPIANLPRPSSPSTASKRSELPYEP